MVYGLTGIIDGAHHVLGTVASLQALRWARGRSGS
jgi:hypothetical protein